MLIAKIENGSITVADYRDLFPDTSFPATGPNDDFYAENGCFKVSSFHYHDQATTMLVSCDPYLEGDFVYTVRAVLKSEQTQEPIIVESSDTSTFSTGAV
jgi:hypothetical protein